MSNKEDKSSEKESPPSVEEIKKNIQTKCDDIIRFCTEDQEKTSFYIFEQSLKKHTFQLDCLFLQLFLMSLQEKLDYSEYSKNGKYYKGDLVPRTIKTIYGKVRYWRNYLIDNKEGSGFYPLDSLIGLTSDGFTPLVMSLATKLATRVSFSTSVLLFRCFYGWSPSSEAIQSLVQGIGRDSSAYMEQVDSPEGDGEVLVIEVDGKATPTATDKELKKRRGKRVKRKYACNCQRHRAKTKRQYRTKNKRRKKGDKSKNGRSITLVVMYTLKRKEDGRLHGPINKKVWGSYAPRKVMFAWARRQATKRGFPTETNKRIHIAVDGEKCLRNGLSELFPKASFALDIRHLEEKIWKVGRTFHEEGSDELEKWVEDKREYLYTGKARDLVVELKKLKLSLSARAKRDKNKREALSNLTTYMNDRLPMMEYKKLIDEDLVIASGIVEGAARYVIGERMDCGGMRWIPERAEALLHLRCIELNGDWDNFFEWGYKRWVEKMRKGEKVIIRTEKPDNLPTIESIDSWHSEYTEKHEMAKVA
jgi:hypothetical protein